jgi:sugar diacid utilization regulator
LHAYADADMNALKAATTLQRHPNTLYARMQRVADITGLSPLSFNALSELLLATDCAMLDK